MLSMLNTQLLLKMDIFQGKQNVGVLRLVVQKGYLDLKATA